MLKDTPVLLNVPPGQPFADSLVRGLMARTKDDPLSLSTYTLLLPSRRAAKTLREAFLRLSGGTAIILPRMQPLGDIDPDEVSLLLAGSGEMPDIPPAIAPLERQLLLAQLVMKTGRSESFDQAAALARELGRFLDEVQAEGLSFDALKGIVPEMFAGHWQQTLEFLKILTEHWPAILKERGVIDISERRNLLLAAQCAAWGQNPPQNPVFAIASTAMTPPMTELLHLVARLPQGAVVLPGLDVAMDDRSWDAIGDDHPQFNMKLLLSRLAASRADVAPWGETENVNAARVRLLSEAMRPAETTDAWRKISEKDFPRGALDNMSRIDCDTAQEEADVIALILREALEEKGKRAALVTPDRRLARRVALSLRRWGIEIDDSGGQPLTELRAGSWLMLTADAAAEELAPVSLLSMLKHPVMAAGMPPGKLRDMVWLLDRLALRGPRPAPGFDGLKTQVGALDNAFGAPLLAWLEKIEAGMAEFAALMASREEKPFRDFLTAHIRMAETLAATEDKGGAERLWHLDSGEAASLLLRDLLAAADGVPDVKPGQYAALLGALLKSVTVRPRYGLHPRLFVLGLIEARLFSADLVVLGGLNEGTWPALPPHDPWMSRPMRRGFGLPSPERGISLAAHDFVQACAAPKVILTRARKVDGAPTVPARWLMRIGTVMEAAGLSWNTTTPARYRQWAQMLDKPDTIHPAPRPAPAPPLEARPRTLSVTQIETWMRDPYQIYAKKVLSLNRLDPVDADPGGAERGTFIHAALEKFVKAFPKALPEDAEQQLLSFGREAITENRIPPEVEAFWWPRFEKIATLFVQEEKKWRQDAAPFLTETRGEWAFAAAGGPFTLKGTADRIDRCTDGTYAVIDYKSGFVPDMASVRQGLSPQLQLEGLMLEKGGFPGAPPKGVSKLAYWRVTGGGEDPVSLRLVEPKGASVEDLMREAELGLAALVDRFDNPATPYMCQPRAEAKPRFSDYDHLARVREWGVGGEDGDA